MESAMTRLRLFFRRHQDAFVSVTAILCAVIGLCLCTGVVGPTLDARAAQHSAQR